LGLAGIENLYNLFFSDKKSIKEAKLAKGIAELAQQVISTQETTQSLAQTMASNMEAPASSCCKYC
jgi:hypothetical protein